MTRDPDTQRYREDARLVERFRAGDREAFELLVSRHTARAGAIAFGVTGEMSAAEDVVQEAFITAYRTLHKLQNPRGFARWFREVVRSRALDWRRKFGKAEPHLGDYEGWEEAGPVVAASLDPSRVAGDEELRRRVREIVGTLPEAQREVVALKYLEGLSYEEIAEATGSSVSSVESRLHRARGRLRQLLARLG